MKKSPSKNKVTAAPTIIQWTEDFIKKYKKALIQLGKK